MAQWYRIKFFQRIMAIKYTNVDNPDDVITVRTTHLDKFADKVKIGAESTVYRDIKGIYTLGSDYLSPYGLVIKFRGWQGGAPWGAQPIHRIGIIMGGNKFKYKQTNDMFDWSEPSTADDTLFYSTPHVTNVTSPYVTQLTSRWTNDEIEEGVWARLEITRVFFPLYIGWQQNTRRGLPLDDPSYQAPSYPYPPGTFDHSYRGLIETLFGTTPTATMQNTLIGASVVDGGAGESNNGIFTPVRKIIQKDDGAFEIALVTTEADGDVLNSSGLMEIP